MLLELKIHNFAVIQSCHLSFTSGFVALTGETGAGKSIIVDALSACLGLRIGSDIVGAGAVKATMEAVFDRSAVSSDSIGILLDEAGIEDGDVLILFREITSSGRSICRVNGRAGPVSLLAAIGAHLVDVHGQSEHLSLLKPARQLDMLDHFGRLDNDRKEFGTAAGALTAARSALDELENSRRTAEQKLDLLRFQIAEIEGAGLQPDEIDSLKSERLRLANAEKLATLSTEALTALDGDELQPAAGDQLLKATQALRQLAEIDRTMAESHAAVEEASYNVRDIAANIRSYRGTIEFDPARLNDIEARLDLINRLCRKYGDTVEEVLSVLDAARDELERVENYERRVAEANASVQLAETTACELAATLSHKRAAAAETFVRQVRDRLSRLGLGPARFEIALSRVEATDGLRVGAAPAPDHGASDHAAFGRVAFTSSGIDRIQFLVAFNTGEALKPIERVASGGETARFMLAVKAVLATADDVPTIIFDEIDTGVGGRSGAVVAGMLAELAASHQVISITHLPQIAARAHQHLKVAKEGSKGETVVSVVEVRDEERVAELAEMLSGVPVAAPALQAARQLLTNVSEAQATEGAELSRSGTA